MERTPNRTVLARVESNPGREDPHLKALYLGEPQREWLTLDQAPTFLACLTFYADLNGEGPMVTLYINGEERMRLTPEEWNEARPVFLQAAGREMLVDEPASPMDVTSQGEG